MRRRGLGIILHEYKNIAVLYCMCEKVYEGYLLKVSRGRVFVGFVNLAETAESLIIVRPGNLLNLRWSNIDPEEGLTHEGMTKNGNPITLPLPVTTLIEMKRFARYSEY